MQSAAMISFKGRKKIGGGVGGASSKKAKKPPSHAANNLLASIAASISDPKNQNLFLNASIASFSGGGFQLQEGAGASSNPFALSNNPSETATSGKSGNPEVQRHIGNVFL